jgi:hypothetical protein
MQAQQIQYSTDRQTQADWQTGRKLCSRKADRVAGKQQDWEAGRQEGRQSGRHADGLVGRQADGRQKGTLADRTYTFVQLLHLLHLRQVMCLHIMHKIV